MPLCFASRRQIKDCKFNTQLAKRNAHATHTFHLRGTANTAMSRSLQDKRPLWKRDLDERRIATELESARSPPRWHAKWRIATWVMIASGAYILLFRTSWGEDDHAFSALQRYGMGWATRFFKVDEEVPPIPTDDSAAPSLKEQNK